MTFEDVLVEIRSKIGALVTNSYWSACEANVEATAERCRSLLVRQLSWDDVLLELAQKESEISDRFRSIEEVIRRHDLANDQLSIENFLHKFKTLPELKQYLTSMDAARRWERIHSQGSFAIVASITQGC